MAASHFRGPIMCGIARAVEAQHIVETMTRPNSSNLPQHNQGRMNRSTYSFHAYSLLVDSAWTRAPISACVGSLYPLFSNWSTRGPHQVQRRFIEPDPAVALPYVDRRRRSSPACAMTAPTVEVRHMLRAPTRSFAMHRLRREQVVKSFSEGLAMFAHLSCRTIAVSVLISRRLVSDAPARGLAPLAAHPRDPQHRRHLVFGDSRV